MRLSSVLFAILFGGGLSGAAQGLEAPADGRLTLDEAKRYAIANNYELAALKKAVEETDAAKGKEAAAFYPSLGVAGGLDTQLTRSGSTTIPLAYVYAEWNIFNGFRDINKLNAADREAATARVQLEKAKFRVGLEVESAFHAYLFHRGSLAVQSEALKLNAEHRKMARRRKNSGLATEADVMEFDIARSLLESEMVSLTQKLDAARIELKRLLGREVGRELEPVGSLQHQHVEGDLMSYLDRIQAESERVQVKKLAVEKAEYERKATNSAWLPEIALQAHAGYETLHERTTNSPDVSAMIVGKFDIFSGFGDVSERRQKTARLMKEEALLKQAILDAITGTEKAYRELKAIQERVDLEEANEDRTKGFYKTTVSEYNRGVKNSSDVRNAAEMYANAIFREQRYKYDFLVAKLNLERIIGYPVKTVLIEAHEHAH
ncbi:MAG: TolC family protein [Bdellovibrionota bacterium]